MDFDEIFGGQRVMAILRGLPPDETVALATRLWDAGVTVLEVPIGTAEAVDSLSAAVTVAAGRGLRVGAGTVITAAQARAAADAGAGYTVAPGLDVTVLAASLAAGLPHLPGVGTASEVQQAYAAGCRWLKAFPAKALGAAWISAMHGPFPSTVRPAAAAMATMTKKRRTASSMMIHPCWRSGLLVSSLPPPTRRRKWQ